MEIKSRVSQIDLLKICNCRNQETKVLNLPSLQLIKTHLIEPNFDSGNISIIDPNCYVTFSITVR